MKIQPFSAYDMAKLPMLQPADWGDIIPHFEFYVQSPFCFPIKLTSAEQIVGVAAVIVHHDVAWLGHIIIHSESRGRGLGRILTQNLIDIACQQKCKTVYLTATDLGFPVYEKLGFVTEDNYLFFKDIDPHSQLRVQSGCIQPYAKSMRSEISEMDRDISGEDRMLHLDAHLEHGYVYRCSEKIEGYYLPSLGEGLIIAVSPSAGTELLKLHVTSTHKAVFPSSNTVAAGLLHAMGYREWSTGRRMRWGVERPLKLQYIYNRIAGKVG